MDPATLTVFATTALSTFFGQMVVGAGTKAGEDAWEQAKRIYEAIKTRFSKEQDDGKASRALTAMADDPDVSDSVKIKLARILESDSAFKLLLEQIIQSGPQQTLTIEEEAEARRIRMRIQGGIGTQDIHAGKRSKIEDVDMGIE